MLDRLESRRLLSVTIVDRVLTITGTDAADRIDLVLVAGDLVLFHAGRFDSFDAAGVDGIIISALGGDDVVTVSSAVTAACTINGGAGNDSLKGGGGFDLLNGGEGRDTLRGGRGSDTLDGGAGDDVLDGGPRGDVLIGGENSDVATYSGRSDDLVIDLDDQPDDGGDREEDNVRSDVEHVYAGSGNDRITGNGKRNRLRGGAGDDTLDGGGADDTLFGGEGADRLIGGRGVDTVDYADQTHGVRVYLDEFGGDGAVLPRTVIDQFGREFLVFRSEGDVVTADIENVIGGSGPDTIFGSAGDNRLFGGPGDDLISGLAGNDTIDGGLGADEMWGGDGIDTIDYSMRRGDLTIRLYDNRGPDGEAGEGDSLGSDSEIILGGSGNDDIRASSGVAVTLIGGAGNDWLQGSGLADRLEGGDGRDELDGRAGDDTLIGGFDGALDVLWGGTGDDSGIFVTGSEVHSIEHPTEVYPVGPN